MNKKITIASLFIVFIFITTPITQAIGKNTNNQVKKELINTIQKTNADDKLKICIKENLEKIDKIDEKTLSYIIKFKNYLEKNKWYGSRNFWLNMAFINFLWGIYYKISGDKTAARYHFKRAIINLMLYRLINK